MLGAAAVFAFYFLNKKSAPQTATTTPVTTGTGGVGGAGTVAITTPGFQIHQDPNQPFATILPRQGNSNEVAILQPAASSAPAATPTISSSDISNPDYANLSTNQFMAKYYPDTQNVVSGANIANVPGTDPALISHNSANSAPTNLNIPDNSAISSSKFTLSQDNSAQAISNYIQSLNNNVSQLDLLKNVSLITSVINNPNQAIINQQLQQTQSILSSLQKMPIPSNTVGMQKEVYLMYQDYSGFLNAMNQGAGPTNPNAQIDANILANQIKSDMTATLNDLDQVNQDQALLNSFINPDILAQ